MQGGSDLGIISCNKYRHFQDSIVLNQSLPISVATGSISFHSLLIDDIDIINR